MVGRPRTSASSNISYNEDSNLFEINNGINKSREIIINITFRANEVGNTRIGITGLEGTIENGLMRISETSRRITVKEETRPTENPTPTTSPTSKPTPTLVPKPTAKPTTKPTPTVTAKPTAIPTTKPTIKPTATPTSSPTNNPIPTENPIDQRPNSNGTGGSTINKVKPTPRPIGVVFVPSNTPSQTVIEPPTETPSPEIVETVKPIVDTKTPEEDYTEVKGDVKLSKASDTAKGQAWVYILTIVAIVLLLIIIILISYTKIKIARVKKLEAGRTDVPEKK